MKALFTVPKGKKITEKAFSRVLISFVCSILICMTCLASTTWAWFTVSIDNTENVIQIGSPAVSLYVNDTVAAPGTVLTEGTHRISIVHAGEEDDLQRKSTLYVTMTVNGTNSAYTVLNAENDYQMEIELQIGVGQQGYLSWEATWFAPANAELLVGDTITIADEEG